MNPAELARLDAAATPGPWRSRITEDGRDPEVYVTGLMVSEGGNPNVPPKFYVAFMPPLASGDREADAALIVFLRNHVPDFLAAMEDRDRLLDLVRRYPSPDSATWWNEERFDLLAALEAK